MGEFYNRDCVEAMREYPDNHFDLAIVDPPYGAANKQGEQSYSRFGQRFERYAKPEQKVVARTGGTWAAKYGKKIVAWDTAPPKEYFNELFRVSRNQIIWGGTISIYL